MRNEQSRPTVAHALAEFVRAIPEVREGAGVASIVAQNDPLSLMELAVDLGSDLLAHLRLVGDPFASASILDADHLSEQILWQLDTDDWAEALSGQGNEGWASTFGVLCTLLQTRLDSPDAVIGHDSASPDVDQLLAIGALALLVYLSYSLSDAGVFSLEVERMALDSLARLSETEGRWSGKPTRPARAKGASVLPRSRTAPRLAETESAGSVRSRAAGQTHLPVEAIVWATSGETFSGLARYQDELWVGTRNGPLVLGDHDGLVVGSHFGRLPHWLGTIGDTILVDYLGEVAGLDPADGGAIWSHPGEAVVAGQGQVMVRQGGRVVAEPTTVTCIESDTGRVKWELHGRGSRPGLFPIGFGRDLAWLSKRSEDNYVCIGADDEGTVVVSSPIGGTASDGHVLGDAIVAGYRWAWLEDLVRTGHGSAWRYSPYPVADDDQSVLWFEDGYMKGTRFWFGDATRPVTAVPGSSAVHADRPDGPGPAWTASAGSFFGVTHRPSLQVLRPGSAGSRDLGTYVRGGPVSDGERLWPVCQHELEDWVLCLDAAVLAAALG